MTTDATRPEFFYFNAQLRLYDTSKAGVTVAFCAERHFDRDRLGEGLKSAVAYPSDPALILLVGLEPNAEAFTDLVPEMESWAPPGVKVAVLLVDSSRTLRILGENPDTMLEDRRLTEYADAIFDAGLSAMFNGAPTVIRSSPGYHFEAPGGKHMTTFVRAGNMLIDSARSSFAATSMLDKVGGLDSIQLISTDTSSINAIAYELRRLQETFYPGESAAVVGSFGGHGALDRRVSLGSAKSTLFLLSVSSTGSLTKRLLEEREGARVIVLIGLGVLVKGAGVMYAPDKRDVTEALDLDEVMPIDRRHCKRCSDYNETVVKIDGEQLLPLAPSVYSRLLTIKEARAWAPKYLQALILLDTVEAHYVPKTRGASSTRRPIYFDFEKFFESLTSKVPDDEKEPIRELREATVARLNAMLSALQPTHVVHLPDSASRALAIAAQNLAGVKQPILLDSRQSPIELKKSNSNKILVVASAASSGSALNALSRDLRLVAADSVVCYFVFMPRTQDADTWAYLKSNLRVGLNTGPTTKVENVVSAWLPSEKTLLGSVWDDEIEYWRKMLLEFEERPYHDAAVATEATRQIEARLAVLLQGRLKNNLFLSSGNDMNDPEQRLVLADNFALWEFSYDKLEVNQASVYMTFAALLDWSRSPGGRKDSLDYHSGDADLELERFFDTTQRQHNLTAIHPFNFDRYNDPITNSSLLRGALPWELDYSVSSGLSASMLAVLDGVIESYQGQGNSALVELLLALAAQRMRLHPKHLDVLIGKLAIPMPPVAKLLTEALRRRQAGEGLAALLGHESL